MSEVKFHEFLYHDGDGVSLVRRTGRVCYSVRRLLLMLFCAASLVAPSASLGADLKEETLKAWDTYIQAADTEMRSRLDTSFLGIEGSPDALQRVRNGEILVSPVGAQIPRHVPSGLIHDWIGVAFIPNARLEDVLSAARDYDNYKKFYQPTVVDSKSLGREGPADLYWMRVVNRQVVADTALDIEYETTYFQIDDRRCYNSTHTRRVREVRHYGKPDEAELPPDQGSGYIWRLYSIARFEERDGGVYVELEAIALSRDIPVGLRWLVNPIVRRVSKNSMLISLQQMEKAVGSTVAEKRKALSYRAATNSYGGATTQR